MKNRPVISFIFLFFTSCVSLDNKTSFVSLHEFEAEYPALLNQITEHKTLVSATQADTLYDFLQKASSSYEILYSDEKRAEWLSILGIGEKQELDRAENNMRDFYANNLDSFWKLRSMANPKTDQEKLLVKLWEDFFIRDKTKIRGRGSGQISDEIARVEDEILKSGSADIEELIEHESQFSQLFVLRNDWAKAKGFSDHLKYRLSSDEITEYDEFHKTLLSLMPKEIPKPGKIRGLVNATLPLYLDSTEQLFAGMGLALDKGRVKYFDAKNVTYNKTFFSMIEPKGEGRIFISLRESKLYPDEFLEELESLVHETGHGIHFQAIDVEPLMFQFLDSTVTETAALFFENILYTREWLVKAFPRKLSDSEIDAIIKNRKISILEMLRYSSFLWKYEKSVYGDPAQDFKKLYTDISKEVNMTKESRYGIWYDTSIFASHDLYYNYYALGFFYAFRLQKLMEKNYGLRYFENPEAGKFLIENIFKYGRSIPRTALFMNVFGDAELPVRECLQYLTEGPLNEIEG
jgi:hypothetical protein